MSNKAPKQLGSQVPIVGESFDNRKAQFIKEVNEVGAKYNIALVPQLVFTREGILPQYIYMDTKEKKTNGQGKESVAKK